MDLWGEDFERPAKLWLAVGLWRYDDERDDATMDVMMELKLLRWKMRFLLILNVTCQSFAMIFWRSWSESMNF